MALFSFIGRSTGNGRSLLDNAKPFCIPKRWVWEAYKRVKANRGAAGVDEQFDWVSLLRTRSAGDDEYRAVPIDGEN